MKINLPFKFSLPFNQGNKKTQIAVAIFLLALLGAFATLARAEPYIGFGVGTTQVRGLAPVIDLSITYPKAGPRDADYSFGVVFIGQSEFRNQTQPNQFAWYGQITDGFGKFDLGLGAAYLQNVDEYNGSHLNFNLSATYRFKWANLTWRHFSNGGTVLPNRGRDYLYLWRAF